MPPIHKAKMRGSAAPWRQALPAPARPKSASAALPSHGMGPLLEAQMATRQAQMHSQRRLGQQRRLQAQHPDMQRVGREVQPERVQRGFEVDPDKF